MVCLCFGPLVQACSAPFRIMTSDSITVPVSTSSQDFASAVEHFDISSPASLGPQDESCYDTPEDWCEQTVCMLRWQAKQLQAYKYLFARELLRTSIVEILRLWHVTAQNYAKGRKWCVAEAEREKNAWHSWSRDAESSAWNGGVQHRFPRPSPWRRPHYNQNSNPTKVVVIVKGG